MSRHSSPSRAPSRNSLARSFISRRQSFESDDENVFSNRHALDFPLNPGQTSRTGFPPPRQQYFDDPFHDPSQEENSSNTVPIAETPHLEPQRSSTTKTRLMIDDAPSTSARGLARASSTSSRLTIPRSQSPYVGPSAPSHPYAMYSQITRNPSVASQSTFRSLPDSSFLAHARPEHPYHMYPQNTVEAEDEDITANGIPLGFPRGNQYQGNSGTGNGDSGDIIGTDGHIEQLPPYTRYADNTVAKGNMDDLNRRRMSRASRVSLAPTHVSEATTGPNPLSESSSAALLPAPREEFEHDTEEQIAKKEGWKERATKRTVAGLPVWVVIVIVLAVIFSATVGGVVGGVIGNQQGAERAYANGARVTTTMWLDAVPTTLPPNSSPLPTGHFQIPLNQSEEINECIPQPDYYPAWGCMDIAYIGVLVMADTNLEDGNTTMKAIFEDFSTNTQDFKYGPQPPDFNGSEFTLTPMKDKDAGDLGVAMFFSVLFDKLSIIPENALTLQPNKRAVDAEQLSSATAPYDGTPLRPSDRPWFCFWNSTINEFFVYVNQEAPAEPSSTTRLDSYGKTSSPHTTSHQSTTSGVRIQELTMTTVPTPTPTTPPPTTFLAYNPTFNPPATTTSAVGKKRSYETSAPNMPNYPKLVKMVEKRKPMDNSTDDYVQPYCQMMQVLDDWSIVPIYTEPPIEIDEVQYPASTPAPGFKRSVFGTEPRDVVAELESYCICEWTSY